MLTSVAALLALGASVSAIATPGHGHIARGHAARNVARGYAQDANLLEPYAGYHTRYIALSCQKKHDTTFFHDCCHPLLLTQKLGDRPSECIPSPQASSSAALVAPLLPAVDEDPLCDDSTTAPGPTITTAAPAPVSTDDGYDDCEDETSAAEPASTTPAPAYTATTSEKPTTKVKTFSSVAEPVTSAEPTTTHSATKTKTKTSSAEPTPTEAPSTGGDQYSGTASFYEQGGVAGACGHSNGDDAIIVAISQNLWGDINKKSSFCDKTVVITDVSNGKVYEAKVADECISEICEDVNHLDFSHGTWDMMGHPRSEGLFKIKWHFK